MYMRARSDPLLVSSCMGDRDIKYLLSSLNASGYRHCTYNIFAICGNDYTITGISIQL